MKYIFFILLIGILSACTPSVSTPYNDCRQSCIDKYGEVPPDMPNRGISRTEQCFIDECRID